MVDNNTCGFTNILTIISGTVTPNLDNCVLCIDEPTELK